MRLARGVFEEVAERVEVTRFEKPAVEALWVVVVTYMSTIFNGFGGVLSRLITARRDRSRGSLPAVVPPTVPHNPYHETRLPYSGSLKQGGWNCLFVG